MACLVISKNIRAYKSVLIRSLVGICMVRSRWTLERLRDKALIEVYDRAEAHLIGGEVRWHDDLLGSRPEAHQQ